ncbi:septum formation family protein [Marmoricola sp. RAF53]|uniref:septum formation family protein n=1 Tax=Marmoricola sp. RAF53 TaxID=3233059 RepID=UPI003F978718
MSRLRTASVVTALLAVVATLLIVSPSDAAPSRGTVTRPKVGQCRTTTFAQSFAASDARKPVSCAKPHRMKTFAVGSLPRKYNPKRAKSAVWGQAASDQCTRRFWNAVAADHAKREQTAYTWSFFIPTKAQRSAGARWIRCDLSLLVSPPGQNSQFALLPNNPFPILGARPITDSVRRCLSDSTHHYWTTCNRAHAARADQTFVLNSTAYPSDQAVADAAATHCPGKRFTAAGHTDWRFGDHVVICYSVTTS